MLEELEPRLVPTALMVNSFRDVVAFNPAVSAVTGSFLPDGQAEVTLRSAIQRANQSSGLVIEIPAGTYHLTIPPSGRDDDSSGDLNILQSMTLTGVSGGQPTIIDATGLGTRVFNVNAGRNVAVNISNLEITGGSVTTGGGGVLNQSGTLNLFGVAIDHNAAQNGEGGGIENMGNLTVIDSTISNNSAAIGGGIANVGGNVLLIYDTIANNSAVNFGGGLSNFSVVVVQAQTFILFKDTILADNKGGNVFAPNTFIQSGGDNIDSDGSARLFGPGDLQVDLRLLPLADYGGPTPTLALPSGSPAIDKGGIDTDPGAPTTDQRGFPRIVGAQSDIGAYEAGTEAISVFSPQSNEAFTPGQVIPLEVQFSAPVFVSSAGGALELELNNGGTAVYEGGSGTQDLIFSYSVISGEGSPQLDYKSASALVANGARISDVGGNAAVIQLPPPGPQDTLATLNLAVQANTRNGIISFRGQIFVTVPDFGSPEPGAALSAVLTTAVLDAILFSPAFSLEPGDASAQLAESAQSGLFAGSLVVFILPLGLPGSRETNGSLGPESNQSDPFWSTAQIEAGPSDSHVTPLSLRIGQETGWAGMPSSFSGVAGGTGLDPVDEAQPLEAVQPAYKAALTFSSSLDANDAVVIVETIWQANAGNRTKKPVQITVAHEFSPPDVARIDTEPARKEVKPWPVWFECMVVPIVAVVATGFWLRHGWRKRVRQKGAGTKTIKSTT
jgi:hypothetical protein